LNGAIFYFQVMKKPHQCWTTNWNTTLATIRTTGKITTFQSDGQVHELIFSTISM